MDTLCSEYANILEKIKPFNILNNQDEKISQSPIYLYVLNYIYKYNLKNILLSLSGGVDSMVLLHILLDIKNLYKLNIYIYCCHLNYNNREESKLERDFLKRYCSLNNVIFNYIDINIKRGEINRGLYEKSTRDIRYKFYSELCETYQCSGVLLAHHKDDICENIFNNIMRGTREITDLKVISEENEIMGVKVFRPMLNFNKDVILDLAHRYNIPYFLDTTPEWSCRGKMRRQIFPVCEDSYTNNYKNNLLKLGNESEELGKIINKYIIDDIFLKVSFNENSFTIPNENVLHETYILKILMRKICHKLSIECMKTRNIETMSSLLKKNNFNKNKIIFMKDYNTSFDIDNIYFNKIKKST